MRSATPTIYCVLSILAVACGGSGTSTPAPHASGPAASGPAVSGPGNETSTPVDEPPAVLSPVRLKLGEREVTFDPSLPDSRFDLGTTSTPTRIYIYGPSGWAFLMVAPSSDGAFDAAELSASITTPEVVDVPIAGTVNVDEVDPSAGRIALTIRGTQVDDGTPIEVDLEATITPAGQ